MQRAMGSREKSTGFLGVEYPNLLFNGNLDPVTQRITRNTIAANGEGPRKQVKSQKSFQKANANQQARSYERNTSFTAHFDATQGQMKQLRTSLN